MHSNEVERKLALHFVTKCLTTLALGSPGHDLSVTYNKIMYIREVVHHFRDAMTLSVEKPRYEDGFRIAACAARGYLLRTEVFPANNLNKRRSVGVDHAMESLQLGETVVDTEAGL